MTNIVEIWKPVKNYEGLYEVSNLGRIRSLPRPFRVNGKLLSTNKSRTGYIRIGLVSDLGIRSYISIHRLVAIAFIPNDNKLPQVNHIDGDKSNNIPENLEWVTAKDNIIHAHKTGLRVSPKGTHNGQSKLTESQVMEIYVANGTRKEIGDRFGVARDTVRSIKVGETWNHLTKHL